MKRGRLKEFGFAQDVPEDGFLQDIDFNMSKIPGVRDLHEINEPGLLLKGVIQFEN